MNRKRRRKLNRSDNTLILMLALPVVILSEDFGFGMKSRTPKFIDRMLERLKQIETGGLEVSEIVDKFEKITGGRIE